MEWQPFSKAWGMHGLPQLLCARSCALGLSVLLLVGDDWTLLPSYPCCIHTLYELHRFEARQHPAQCKRRV